MRRALTRKMEVMLVVCFIGALVALFVFPLPKRVPPDEAGVIQQVSEQIAKAEPGDIVVLKNGLILGVERVDSVRQEIRLRGESPSFDPGAPVKSISHVASGVNLVVSQRNPQQHSHWTRKFFYQYMGIPDPLSPTTLPAEAP